MDYVDFKPTRHDAADIAKAIAFVVANEGEVESVVSDDAPEVCLTMPNGQSFIFTVAEYEPGLHPAEVHAGRGGNEKP